MILQVFSVKDRAIDAFGTPMFFQTKGQAIRSFTDEVNRASEDNILYKHADDYDLFELGRFNAQTAMFESTGPTLTIMGRDVKQTK